MCCCYTDYSCIFGSLSGFSLLIFDKQSPDALTTLWVLRQSNISYVRWSSYSESSGGCFQRVSSNAEMVRGKFRLVFDYP
jgi:hypothetical protein